MRDLASIVSVEAKNKMFEKDKICVVTFNENGYEAIVPNTVNVGDRMVFIQEGAILPGIERWEFLRKRCYVDSLKGFLIRPITMGAKDYEGTKGDRVKSWGLCVTLAEAGLPDNLTAGTDVTDMLQIRKYEPTEDASPTKTSKTPKWVKFCMKHALLRWIGKIWFNKNKKITGNFPSEIISKSDETTIQNYKSVVNQFAGKKAFITAKIEGQSFTCSIDAKHKNKFYVCSRNNRFDTLNSTSEVFFKTAESYDIERKLKAYYKTTGVRLIIQGEQAGPGIQGNIYDFDTCRWFVFRMKGYEDGHWVEYNYEKMSAIANTLGLECVPLLEVVEDMSVYDLNSLVARAERAYWIPGNYDYTPSANEVMWKNYLQHEGIVVKSADYNKELNIGFSFKVKNISYQEHAYTEMHTLAHSLNNKAQ